MTPLDLLVISSGLAAIAWVNWYFLVAGGQTATAAVAGSTGPAKVLITVDGGYDPRVVRVPAGAPVRLLFDRRDRSPCSEEIVLPDFGIRRFLPHGTQTPIDITAPAPGEYEFTCGMSMMRGRIIAE